MNDANWFHVFDSTNSLWLHDDRSWGPYRGAAEFSDLDEAQEIALHEIKNKGSDYEGTVIVLADHGQVEA